MTKLRTTGMIVKLKGSRTNELFDSGRYLLLGYTAAFAGKFGVISDDCQRFGYNPNCYSKIVLGFDTAYQNIDLLVNSEAGGSFG